MPSIQEPSSPRRYRGDIDGLRAVAIILVILYHSGMHFFRGGYTGVDIFFVISGYLIGGHIYSEKLAGTFSYWSFYCWVPPVPRTCGPRFTLPPNRGVSIPLADAPQGILFTLNAFRPVAPL